MRKILYIQINDNSLGIVDFRGNLLDIRAIQRKTGTIPKKSFCHRLSFKLVKYLKHLL